jgi:Ca-activated chloride channel family protein
VSFQSPWLLLTLLAVPALIGYLVLARRRPARAAVVYTNLDLLAEQVTPGTRRRRAWLPLALLLLAIATASAAVARPRAQFTTVARHSSVVLLVDVSGSMNARDVEPTRLDAAASAMRTFLDRLPKQVDVGLVQFSSEPEVIQAPTQDRALVRESLGYLFADAGTAIGDALAVSARLVRGDGAIVLLSDGTQTRGRLTPLGGAARARAAGARVDTIALGTPGGKLYSYAGAVPVPPDPALMGAIAHATGGRSFTAKSSAQLAGVYSHLGGTLARRRSSREITSWFAVASAALLLAGVGLGRLWGPSLP